MKCGLCKFTPKGKRDMDRHVREIHKLTWDQYAQAVKAVAPAVQQINTLNAALISSGLRKAGLVVLALFLLGGCRGVDRLLGQGDDPGTPYIPPHGRLAEQNVQPVYDQATATQAQDDNIIRKVIGDPASANFQTYVTGRETSGWSPSVYQNMAGVHNLMTNPPIGFSSILVDAWKAMFRRGYFDESKLADPSVIHSNTYPVPVYQDDPGPWHL